MKDGKIDSIFDLTDKGIREIEAWLEPWFRAKFNDRLGLQYNNGTYGPHNVGDWLSVETTGSSPDGSNEAVRFLDTGGAGMLFESSGGSGDMVFANEGLGQTRITSAFDDTIVQSGLAGVQVIGGTGVSISASTGHVQTVALTGTTSAMIQNRLSAGNYFIVSDNTPIDQFRVTIGGSGTDSVMQVADATGALIFKVCANGDLHGKTGKALVFDL